MIKRIIDISEGAYVHLKNQQMLVDKAGKCVGQIPVEDLGAVILDHPAIIVSQAAVIACQKNNVAIVYCDEKHLPYSVVLPISEGHSLHQKVLRLQLNLSLPHRKRIWRQIIQQKIYQQSFTLKLLGKSSDYLEKLAKQVKSGDRENHEAQAAQRYWKLLMGENFKRDCKGEGVNSILNYGYAIIRAMVARALVGSGLHPALGLHHHNQYNGLCLADDLMEPFRPWVDRIVFQLFQKDENFKVDKETKRELLALLSKTVSWNEKNLPMMVAFHYMAADLKRVYEFPRCQLNFPQLLEKIKN